MTYVKICVVFSYVYVQAPTLKVNLLEYHDDVHFVKNINKINITQ